MLSLFLTVMNLLTYSLKWKTAENKKNIVNKNRALTRQYFSLLYFYSGRTENRYFIKFVMYYVLPFSEDFLFFGYIIIYTSWHLLPMDLVKILYNKDYKWSSSERCKIKCHFRISKVLWKIMTDFKTLFNSEKKF